MYPMHEGGWERNVMGEGWEGGYGLKCKKVILFGLFKFRGYNIFMYPMHIGEGLKRKGMNPF